VDGVVALNKGERVQEIGVASKAFDGQYAPIYAKPRQARRESHSARRSFE
jgi:hypothetical protein